MTRALADDPDTTPRATGATRCPDCSDGREKPRPVKPGPATPVAILEVIDTGKGIPLKVQERLFDPFFTTKESGTGLGLSIAVRIVEKHGGALQYQTEVDRGTTFGIVLPRVAQEGA